MTDPNEFRLLSRWHIPAPRESVWNALRSVHDWPQWWRYVAAVTEIEPGDANGVGALHRFRWTSRLPYSLTLAMRTVEVQRGAKIRARAEGDLRGEGFWFLGDAPGGTDVEYTWTVTLAKPWMRHFARVLRPVFAWNHRAVMSAGEQGLTRWLESAVSNTASS